MTPVGQIEKKTQQRVVELFRDTLDYEYLGVLELKRSTVAVAEGIRQNLDNQKKVFIEHFFATAQWVMAGNDTEGLRYANIETPEKISAFDDLSLVELIVERGVDAVKALPEGIRENRDAVAETIENNVRRLIIDDSPINPKYYERMSELLDVLIAQSASNYGIPTDAEFDHLVERLLELAKRQHDY